MLWGLLAFGFLTVVVLYGQVRIAANAHDIRRLFYTQCVEHNATTTRQNGLIDRAIDAERRRTQPNADTINGLNAFKDKIVDCGRRP